MFQHKVNPSATHDQSISPPMYEMPRFKYEILTNPTVHIE